MRVTSWNLLHGRAIPPDPAVDAAALLEAEILNLKSDVIGVQEVDYFLERSGNHNQVGNIATVMGAADWAFAPSLFGNPDEKWRKPEKTDLKIVTDKSQEGEAGYGIGMVSKLPVKSWHRLDLKGAPFGVFMMFPVDGKLKRFYVRDHPRSALAAHLENGWLIINTHLSFVPFFNYRQLVHIKRRSRTLGADPKKILFMGDMNIPIRKVVAGLKWNSLATGKTFPSWLPKVEIDFMLSPTLTASDVKQNTYSHKGMSDHLPLQIEIPTD
jgi:endonuclease/exonuclease/phosphatase family metal-dependent hydrolase